MAAGLKAGTLKDWTKSRSYSAVLRRGGEIVWTCDHSHDAAQRALDCAWTELNQRTQAVS